MENLNEGKISGINSKFEPTPERTTFIGGSRMAEKERKLYEEQAESRATTIHNIFRWTLWLIFVAVGCIAVIRVYHYLAPSCWRWLCPEQLNEVDGMLSTGVIGALVAKYGETMTDLLHKSKNHNI